MGDKFEVWSWRRVSRSGEYDWAQTWRGQSLIKALLAMRRARKTCYCVRLEWR